MSSKLLNEIWDILDLSRNEINDNQFYNKPICIGCKQSDFIIDVFVICSYCGIVSENTCIIDTKEPLYNDLESGKNNASNEHYTKVDSLFPICSTRTYMSGSQKTPMAKRHLWSSGISNEEKTLRDLKTKLTELSILYNFPDYIIRNILWKFKIILSVKIYRGSVKDGLIAVCFYYTCKENKMYPLLSFIKDIFNIDTHVFNNCSKIYKTIFPEIEDEKFLVTTNHIISETCNRLNLEYKIYKLCININDAITTIPICDINNFISQCVSSGIIYFVTKELKMYDHIKDSGISMIANICYVGKCTILKINKLLCINKDEIFLFIKDKKFKNK